MGFLRGESGEVHDPALFLAGTGPHEPTPDLRHTAQAAAKTEFSEIDDVGGAHDRKRYRPRAGD